MSEKYVLGALAMFVVACSPLLDADFNGLPNGALADGVVNLAGSPNGDQMVVSSEGGSVTIETGVFDQQHLRISTGAPSPEVTFRPVRGDSDKRIFISYDALISGASARGRIVFRNLDDRGDSDAVPDMTLDFVQADANVGEPPVTATGWKMNGIVGKHSVVVSIDPDGGSYTATVAGEDVTGSPALFEFTSIDGSWRANPPRFEITITTDPDGGSGSYQVDDLLITEN